MKSLIIAVLVWAVLSASISSCKKTIDGGPPPPPTDSASTYLLDTAVFILKDTNLTTGVFHYSAGGQTLPHFKKGDFIVEPRNFGYLRKIDDLKEINGDLYFYTEQATMNDVFKNQGDFKLKFTIPGSKNPYSFASGNSKRSKTSVNSSSKENGSSSILDVAPDYTISIPGLDLTFKRFYLNFNPAFNTAFSVQNKSFSLGLDSTPVSWGYDVAFQKPNNGVLNTTDTFHLQNYFPANISNLFTRVPIEAMGPNGIPVFGDVSLDLLCIINYNGANAIFEEFTVGQQRQVAMNLIYQNGHLDSKFQYTIPFNENFYNVIFNDLNGMDASVSIIPVYKFNFYNTFLTNISFANKMSIGVESSVNPVAWDERAQTDLHGTIDFDNSILGFSDKSETKTSSAEFVDTVYTAPASIISTGSVTGKPGDNIPYSIELQDSRGMPVLFPTSVYYTTDNGSWDNPVVLSDPGSGSATNNFTLGTGANNVQILVKDAKNNVLTALSTQFVSSDTVATGILKLVAIGPYPVPGLIPGFAGNPTPTYVAAGSMVFVNNSAAAFYVKITDGSNADLYSGNAMVNYYGHDNGGQPYFVTTDSSYVGAQLYPGKGWGCMMPPGFEVFFTIGGDGYVGDNTLDRKTVLLLPVGYCVFQ